MVQQLLIQGACVHAVNKASLDQGQETSLHIAAKKGRLAVIELLVNAGADVSAINKKRETAYDLGSEEIKAWFKRMNTIETTKAQHDAETSTPSG
ncbi:hypothetical protein AC1031_021684 [Aphanomyces cochlioides]|nr:hypothetical protein AC1031_021684 [Aphanomyces cochlioides]